MSPELKARLDAEAGVAMAKRAMSKSVRNYAKALREAERADERAAHQRTLDMIERLAGESMARRALGKATPVRT